MQLNGLRQEPGHNSFVGAVTGAGRYLGLPGDANWYSGATAHAFALNIHTELCPSGPYLCPRQPLLDLLANTGLRAEELGWYSEANTAAERAAAEERLRAHLDAGWPGLLMNLEWQLVTGYDETGFDTAQPNAPEHDFPPARLSFGTWAELDEIHMNVYLLHPVPPAPRREAVCAALAYAVNVLGAGGVVENDYGLGPTGWANWRAAVEAGQGVGFGPWWNATFWSTCRAQAAGFLRAVGAEFDLATEPAAAAAERVAGLLANLIDQDLPTPARLALIAQAAADDGELTTHLGALLAAIEQGAA